MYIFALPTCLEILIFSSLSSPHVFRDGIVTVKIDYQGWEKIRDLALKAGCFEAAEVYNTIKKRRLEELRYLEKEEAELEAACFRGEK